MRPIVRYAATLLAWLAIAVGVLAVPWLEAAPFPLTPVILGSSTLLSNAPIYIAIEEGYFAAWGVEARLEEVRMSAQAWPSLIAGQLDLYAGSYNAGLVEAIRRGARLRIVADKWHMGVNDRGLAFMVRQDLIDSGRFRTLRDLRGLRISVGSRGGAGDLFRQRVLRNRAFLTEEDVTFVQVPSAFVLDAFKAKTIDAALTGEPYVTRLETLRLARIVVTGDEVLPRAQLSVVVYGTNLLARNPGLGQRIMNGYVRGTRQYNEGKTERNIAIIRKYTGDDEATVRQMQWPQIHADGHLNVESIMEFQAWWVREGFLPQVVPRHLVVDLTFTRRAALDLAKPR